jgi:hypothetical protein
VGQRPTGYFIKKKNFSRKSRNPWILAPPIYNDIVSPWDGTATDLYFGMWQTREFFTLRTEIRPQGGSNSGPEGCRRKRRPTGLASVGPARGRWWAVYRLDHIRILKTRYLILSMFHYIWGFQNLSFTILLACVWFWDCGLGWLPFNFLIQLVSFGVWLMCEGRPLFLVWLEDGRIRVVWSPWHAEPTCHPLFFSSRARHVLSSSLPYSSDSMATPHLRPPPSHPRPHCATAKPPFVEWTQPSSLQTKHS